MFRSDIDSGAVLQFTASRDAGQATLQTLIAGLSSGARAALPEAIATPAPASMTASYADVGRLPEVLGWPTRSRRVLWLLVATAVLNFFDLGSTLIESQRFHFEELNPVASAILHLPAIVLIGYKMGLVLLGSYILYALRHHSIAEWASWLALSIYVGVTLRWGVYYTHLLESMNDPATNVCAMTGQLLN